nr:alpha/beta fold hydrolase [Candidatus Sigynarchaeum springense]
MNRRGNAAKQLSMMLVAGLILLVAGSAAAVACGVGATRIIDFKNSFASRRATIIAVTLDTAPDVSLSGTIFVPKDNSSSMPAVILQHGMGGRKENYLEMALNFVARGFVVATFDLRAHGRSTGICTLGNEESDDIVKIIDYIGSSINNSFANVSSVGLVGHSLGAITVILAAIKSGVNSCVAIAAPASVGGLLTAITGASVETVMTRFSFVNPLADQEFLDNVTLLHQLENRSAASDPLPKNLLLCAGLADTSVSSESVYDLFKVAINQSSPANNTTYGSFETGDAIKCNVYSGMPHGAQQYPHLTPELTRDAILWTERALLGAVGAAARDPLDVGDLLKVDFNAGWGAVEWEFIVTLVLFAVAASTFMYDRSHRPGNAATPAPWSSNKFMVFKPLDASNARATRRNLAVNFMFIAGVAVLAGSIATMIYIRGVVHSVMVEIAIRGFVLAAIPLAALLAIIVASACIRNAKAPYNNAPERNAACLLHVAGIARKPEGLLFAVLLGAVIGIALPGGIVALSDLVGVETIFKKIASWPDYIASIAILAPALLAQSTFSSSYIARLFPSQEHACKKASTALIVAIVQGLLVGALVAIAFALDPVFSGRLSIAGISFVLWPGLALIGGVVGFVAGLVDAAGRGFSGATGAGAMFAATFLPWLLMSVITII